MTQDQDINQRSEQASSIAGAIRHPEGMSADSSPHGEVISDSIDSVSLLKDTARDICALAEQHQQDSLFLLSLLRDLEQIHRRIRVDYFESALPQTRNDLYQVVRDIEDKGGWPYIERMRLRDLLKNLEPQEIVADIAMGEISIKQQNESEEI